MPDLRINVYLLSSITHPLGFACAPRGVEEEERMLAVHHGGGEGGAGRLHGLLEPLVPAGHHVHLGSCPLHHQDSGDEVPAVRHRLVHRGLEGDVAAAPHSLVRRHHNPRTSVSHLEHHNLLPSFLVLTLAARASAENPANTTLCTAPILAVAIMTATAMGLTGR